MRIAAVGDTHGRIEPLKRELIRIRPDQVLFTGDFYGDALRLSHHVGVPVQAVVGNCDAANAGPHELLIEVQGKRFYLVHGHQYGVKLGLQSLFYRGREQEADVVLFGHTHVSCCELIEDVWLINPGSPSRPRGGTRGSYCLIDIDDRNLVPRIIEI
ncbi:MAG: metallophosphoesterase family protein [Deltaproteobacteria bacterium]